MTTTSDSISVAVRVRPAQNSDDPVEWIVQDNVIYAAQPEYQHNVFAFDHILAQEKTNIDVYEETVRPIIKSVMDGYHGTVFAYGQTSSGKTHTMMGNAQDPGVIQRTIGYIFDYISKATNREFLIRISYLEIYNEQIRDLLNNSTASTNLQVKGPDMAVAGLTERVTTNAEELLGFMSEGDKNRQVGCTNMNERSSRSHSIFRITVESSKVNPETKNREGVTISQLNLVDLAGSERATQTGATGARLREGCHINTSLSALGLVIRKLSNGEKHINFRDSKLTRILQNSLGGNSRTAIICNISPSDYETSLSTLRFGSDAKRIRNKPVINQVLSGESSVLHKRNKEIESLKALIDKVEAGKEQQLKEKDETITQLQKKIEGLQNLAINSEYGLNKVTTRNNILPPMTRADIRRRETWCPGQLAAATPAKSNAPFQLQDDDSFISKYGVYQEDEVETTFPLCTPARNRKRKSSDLCFTREETDVKSNDSQETIKDGAAEEEVVKLRNLYEEVMEKCKELEEELEFVKNEREFCNGKCTPAAKRQRLSHSPEAPKTDDKPTAGLSVTPCISLSLIKEEDSELEEDSPFGSKLKVMATPRQKIQDMRKENRKLKKDLLAMSTFISPVPSSGSASLSGRDFPQPENLLSRIDTCDASCQYDLEMPVVQTNTSRASWLESEEMPTQMPFETREIAVQVSLLESQSAEDCDSFLSTEQSQIIETPVHASILRPKIEPLDAQTSTSDLFIGIDSIDAETSAPEISNLGQRETRSTSAGPDYVIDYGEVGMQTDPEIPVKPPTGELGCQYEVSHECQFVQCSVDMRDFGTSPIASDRTEVCVQKDMKKQTTPVAPRIHKYSMATRCMESPVSASPANGGIRGLDALLVPESQGKKETRDFGVMVQLEEMWVIKMKHDQERTAREEAESKLDKVWQERDKLLKTNDKYLAFLRKNNIDPQRLLSSEDAGSKVPPLAPVDPSGYASKYRALKDFCLRHPDIKQRVLSENVLIKQRHAEPTISQSVDSKISTAPETPKIPDPAPSTATRENIQNERPLLESNEGSQNFRGVKYMAEADPSECRPS